MQIWCAIATYVLIAIVKKQLQLESSLYTCLQIQTESVFVKTQVAYALRADQSIIEPTGDAIQLLLYTN